MSRIISSVLVLMLLLSLALVGVNAEAAEGFRFTRENFPRLDGSTSLIPLGQGIASMLLGESREDAEDLICFNRTTQSFRNLQYGECDIVIAAEPKSEVFDEMNTAGFPYQLETIAKEALVFVVNENNPVSSLTTEQVRGIYAGEITNWAQVGGDDLPIAAFQRNPSAGSQVMMEKLVMQDTPMMDAPSTMVPQAMGDLIDAVRGYDNSANAIGYTVFYYAADMQMAKGLKILQIDGIAPCAQTIRSEEYPFLNGYYCCINAEAAPDSPERILFDWLVSDAGQRLLTMEGYVSLYAPGEAPTDGRNVVTDDSAYVPNGGIQATYTLFDCPHDHLEPAEGYGDIFPYDGMQLYGAEAYAGFDYHYGSMVGFFNHSGQLITNPIFTDVQRFSFTSWPADRYIWIVSTGDGEIGFITRDGSRISELCYQNLYEIGGFLVGIRDYEAGVFDLYDTELQLVKTQDDFVFDGIGYMPFAGTDGFLVCHTAGYDYDTMHYLLLNPEGQVLLESEEYISVEEGSIVYVSSQDEDISLYDLSLNPFTIEGYPSIKNIYAFGPNFLRAADWEQQVDVLIDRDGTLFEWDYDEASLALDGSIVISRNQQKRLYDKNGRLLFDGLPATWEYAGFGCIFAETDVNGLYLHKLPGNETLYIPHGSMTTSFDEVIAVFCFYDGSWEYRIVDPEMNLLPQHYSDLIQTVDQATGKTYLTSMNASGFAGEQRIFSADGRTEYFRANGVVEMIDGFFTVSNDTAFTCYDPDGNVIFCYPFYGMGSGD